MNRVSLTIFGGTGDLSYRKLFPAIYNLFLRDLLDDFVICAVGRRDYSNDEFIKIIDEWIREFARLKVDDKSLNDFYGHVKYLKMDFTNIEEYKLLDEFYSKYNFDNNIIYYAVAPSFFEIISDGVYRVKSIKNPKIILEKPFGTSLEDACVLSKQLDDNFGKDNIYRIDHYLGKEMVRNILTIRDSNPIISKVWNSNDIESVEISALEEVGVETRGNYYDDAGALKDMVQNHLLQILSIVALDNPNGVIADEQLEVLKSIRKVDSVKDSVVLGQYNGYLSEDKVSPTSDTETYAGIKLFIDNERWRGVPFYIRTGKKLERREIEVLIKFKKNKDDVSNNVLIIKIQPVEGIYLEFNIKTPGGEGVTVAKMEFCQNCNLEFRQNTPEAYERMILACIENDSSWFSKWEQIELSWRFIDDLKEKYAKEGLPLYTYEEGSEGPKEYESLKA